ncbi:hypothetical protein [Streptomyces sp. NPDC006355]|uniref:hypothetical protein n=1 Tax=Streptomyces sp. NPDC006355 TaxID=3156758 RepID=UPI0033AD47FF
MPVWKFSTWVDGFKRPYEGDVAGATEDDARSTVADKIRGDGFEHGEIALEPYEIATWDGPESRPGKGGL